MDFVKLLLKEKKVDVNFPNTKGEYPIHQIIQLKKNLDLIEILDLLEQNNADMS